MHSDRNYELDFIRVVAALDIVLLHVTAYVINQGEPTRAIFWLNGMTQWGVPVFLACSGYLFGEWLKKSADPLSWLTRRANRLLTPYVVWTLVYMAMLTSVAVLQGLPLPHWEPLNVLVAGGAYSPLWYLPALFYSSAIGLLATTRLGLWRLWAGLALLAIISTLCSSLGLIPGGFFSGLPLVAWTYLSGAVVANFDIRVSKQTAAISAILIVATLTGFALTLGGPDSLLVSTARQLFWSAAGPLILWCLISLRTPSVSLVRLMTPYLLGVYLAHSVWLEVFARLVPDATLSPLLWVGVTYPLVASVTVASVALGSRLRVLRPALM